MTVIPCDKNAALRKQIEDYAEVLKTEAHKLGNHGLDEKEFYESGLFRGAIERLRGQFSATMREKREFVQHILNHMEDRKFIAGWESAGEANRHDYSVALNSGRIGIIELKGCLDGNNTNIFERPPQANEFIIWSVCSNPAADPQHNIWSGIHTRLSAEIVSRSQVVDGLIFWDFVCGTIGRPCPKLIADSSRVTKLGSYSLPPPCIYLFPGTVPSPRNNPEPPVQKLRNVELLEAFHKCFAGYNEEVYEVTFEVAHHGNETVRKTKIIRDGVVQRSSGPTAIRRT